MADVRVTVTIRKDDGGRYAALASIQAIDDTWSSLTVYGATPAEALSAATAEIERHIPPAGPGRPSKQPGARAIGFMRGWIDNEGLSKS